MVPQNLMKLKINNSVINQVINTKFLGIIIDDKLSWNLHIKSVCNKINKMCGMLHLTKHLLTKEARRHVYHTLLYPSIIYCNTVWGHVPPSKLKPLVVAQK